MVSEARVKLYGFKGRHSINLPGRLVHDSAFPFGVGEDLVARVDGKRLVIERASTKGRK